MPGKKLVFSPRTIRCDVCHESVYMTPFTDRYLSTMVTGGYSVGGLLMEAHQKSNCTIGTRKDMEAHGVKVP